MDVQQLGVHSLGACVAIVAGGQSCHRRCMNQRVGVCGRSWAWHRLGGARADTRRLPRNPTRLSDFLHRSHYTFARLHARDTTRRRLNELGRIQQLFAAISHFHAQHFHNSNLHTNWQFGPKKRTLPAPFTAAQLQLNSAPAPLPVARRRRHREGASPNWIEAFHSRFFKWTSIKNAS